MVGVTPTYGRVSRYGLVAFASSLDHIGPFARNVRDAATLLEVIAGRDELDSTSADAPVPDYAAALDGNVTRHEDRLAARVFQRPDQRDRRPDRTRRSKSCKKLGCEVREISLPATDYAIACYYIICTAEASSNLARYDGVRYTFRSAEFGDAERHVSQHARRRIRRRVQAPHHAGHVCAEPGYYDAYYLKAQKVRALIARDFTNAFAEVDAIVAPVSPFPAFKLGEKMDDPLAMYLSDIYTITGDLAGIPCMSVPCGTTAEGLPVGLQILCQSFRRSDACSVWRSFERRIASKLQPTAHHQTQ